MGRQAIEEYWESTWGWPSTFSLAISHFVDEPAERGAGTCLNEEDSSFDSTWDLLWGNYSIYSLKTDKNTYADDTGESGGAVVEEVTRRAFVSKLMLGLLVRGVEFRVRLLVLSVDTFKELSRVYKEAIETPTISLQNQVEYFFELDSSEAIWWLCSGWRGSLALDSRTVWRCCCGQTTTSLLLQRVVWNI